MILNKRPCFSKDNWWYLINPWAELPARRIAAFTSSFARGGNGSQVLGIAGVSYGITLAFVEIVSKLANNLSFFPLL